MPAINGIKVFFSFYNKCFAFSDGSFYLLFPSNQKPDRTVGDVDLELYFLFVLGVGSNPRITEENERGVMLLCNPLEKTNQHMFHVLSTEL
jgi:hypothetical protein